MEDTKIKSGNFSPCLSSTSKKIRVIWDITNKCNLKCKHCAVESKKSSALQNLEKYFKALESMEEAGVDTVYLSGGEPLLFDYLYDLIDYGKRLGLEITIGTNGTLLNERSAKKLKDANIDRVFVSLDHWRKEKHDWLRGNGTFEKTINGIKLLKKYEVYTRIDSIVWKENYKELEKLVDFCKKLKADEIIFAWPVKVGSALKNYDYIFPPEEEYLKIGEKLEALRKSKSIKVSYHRFRYFDESAKDCPGGRKIFYINGEGRISPCFWLSTMLDLFTERNIFEEEFSSLLEDYNIQEFRKIEERRHEKFGPGCPAVCKIYNKTIYSKDPLLLK